MIHTTFQRAHEAGACASSYRKMAKALGGIKDYGEDTPIGLDRILEVCGLEDALWSLYITIEPIEKEARLFACDCAERVLPLFEAKSPDDERPRKAIETARRFAEGTVSREELAAAGDAAWAAGDAARAAWAAGEAARYAAGAAGYAAWAAGAAGEVARYAAGAAAWGAAGDAEREWQRQRFLLLLGDS